MAITVPPWEAMQKRIWSCEACKGYERVQVNVRQQTPMPVMPVRLLLVGIAPPDQGSPAIRTTAKSATNDPDDKLRQFIEEASALAWEDLIAKRVFLIHAVKCAIVPEADGFQNPPKDVVDRRIPIGFLDELLILQPPRVVTFGAAGRRAVLKHPAVTAPRGVGVSKTFLTLQESWPRGILCKLGSADLTLHPAPFPRSPVAKNTAAVIVRGAVRLAGIQDATG
jgi:hypothetical protein